MEEQATLHTRQRYLEIDTLRGIAIVGIVMMHAGWHLPSSPTISIVSTLSAFAVPAFLVMAGMLMGASPDRAIMNTFLHKVRHLYWPFAAWTIVYLAYRVYVEGLQLDPLLVFSAFIQGSAEQHLYFVPLIIASYTAFQLFREKQYNPKIILMVGIALLLVVSILGRPQAITWSACYFSLGYYLHRHPLYRQLSPRVLIGLCVIAVASLAVLLSTPTASPPYLLTLIPYSVAIILLLLCLGHRLGYVPGLLATLGRYSFGIYLSHWLVLDLLAMFLSAINGDAAFVLLILGALTTSLLATRIGQARLIMLR